jgi:serine/threonine protein kinase
MSETLGRYRLDRKLATGGMAEVFLAHRLGDTTPCVVKRAFSFLSDNPDFARMFLQEAQLAAQLNHPNIARIFELGQAGGTYFLAMEYVPGLDLLQVIELARARGEPLAPHHCASIIAQAARALHHAHDAIGHKGEPLNIIHRDVSPHNILLSRRGEVKLIDFGVAKASTFLHRTRAGMIKGKYPYMSPEQVAGDPLDRRADLYSLGLVLFELLTRERAIPGSTEGEVIENASHARILPVWSLRPDLPHKLAEVLMRCLAADRDRRWPTAEAVALELERFIAHHGEPVTPADLARLVEDPKPALATSPFVPLQSHSAAAAGVPLPAPERPERPTIKVVPIPLRDVVELGAPVAHTLPSAMAVQLTEKFVTAPEPKPKRRWPLPAIAASLGVVIGVLALAGPLSRALEQLSEPSAVAQAPANPPPPVPAAVAAPTPPAEAPAPVAPAPARPTLQAAFATAAAEEPAAEPSAEPAAAEEPAPAAGGSGAPAPPPPEPEDPAIASALTALGATTTDEPPAELPPAHRASKRPPPRPPAELLSEPLVAAKPKQPSKMEATLTITSSPPLEIEVDGQYQGRSPVTLDLSPGRHNVTWFDESLKIYRTAPLTLRRGEERTEEWSPAKGTLVVDVVPFGEIVVDGESFGVTSFKSVDLWEGTRILQVINRETGREETTHVLVKPGKEVAVRVDLRPSE